MAVNYNKNRDALDFALKAETLSPSVGSASMVALAQQNLGNKQRAIEYYKKSISRYKNPSLIDLGDVDYIKAVILSLGGSI